MKIFDVVLSALGVMASIIIIPFSLILGVPLFAANVIFLAIGTAELAAAIDKRRGK